MNDIYLFRCPSRAFVGERVFVSADITWSKLRGLIAARLNLSDSDSISHLTLGKAVDGPVDRDLDTDISSIERFKEACVSLSRVDPLDSPCFLVHLGEPRNSAVTRSSPELHVCPETSGNADSSGKTTDGDSNNANASKIDERGSDVNKTKGTINSIGADFDAEADPSCTPPRASLHNIGWSRDRGGSRRSHPMANAVDKAQQQFQSSSTIQALKQGNQRPPERNSFGIKDSIPPTSTVGLSNVVKESGDEEVVLVHFMSSSTPPEGGHDVVTLSLAPHCDWNCLGAELSKALEQGSNSQEWQASLLKSGQWSLLLLDEDGDTVSGKIDSAKKFWKFAAMQRRSVDEALLFSLVPAPSLPSTEIQTRTENGSRRRHATGMSDSSRSGGSYSPGSPPATDKESVSSSTLSSSFDLAEEDREEVQPQSQFQHSRRQRHFHPVIATSSPSRSGPVATPERRDINSPSTFNHSALSSSQERERGAHIEQRGQHGCGEEEEDEEEGSMTTRNDQTPVSTTNYLRKDLGGKVNGTPNSSGGENTRRWARQQPSEEQVLELESGPQGEVFQACLRGELQRLQQLVEDGEDGDGDGDEERAQQLLYTAVCTSKMRSALHYACEGGNRALLKWLLLKYKDWNALDIIYGQDSLGFTPLHLLCKEGNVVMLRFLRNEVLGGPHAPLFLGSVRAHDDTGLVHICALHARHETLSWLFQDTNRPENAGGALDGTLEVNAVNAVGATPLHLACAHSDIRMARLLVDLGAFVNTPDEAGNTPLFVSCFRDDLVMAQWLHANGATYAQYNKKGFSVLHVASRRGNGNMARWLVMNGLGDYSLKSDTLGVSPMDEADKNEHDDVYNMFVDMLDAEEESFARHESFFDCIQEGRVTDVVVLLDEQDLDVNCEFPGGNRALHVACSTGCHEMMELLITHYGANVDARHKSSGVTALQAACLQDQRLIAQWLVSVGGANPLAKCFQGNSVLHYACQSGNILLPQWFLDLGGGMIDVNVTNIDGFTPLYMACQLGFTDIAACLLQHGANPYAPNAYGMTLLHAASEGGQSKTVTWLLDEFPDSLLVNTQNFHGWTAFHLACAGGHLEVAQTLLQVSPSAVDINAFVVEDCNSALHAACKNGHADVVAWLAEGMDVGAIVTGMANAKGRSPCQLARDAGKLQVVEWLEQQLEQQQQDYQQGYQGQDQEFEQLHPGASHDSNGENEEEDHLLPSSKASEKESPKTFSSFFSCIPVHQLKRQGSSIGTPPHSTSTSTPKHSTQTAAAVIDTPLSEEVVVDAWEIIEFIKHNDVKHLQMKLNGKDATEVSRLLSCIPPEHNMTALHHACEAAAGETFRALKSLIQAALPGGRGAVATALRVPESIEGNTPLHLLCTQNPHPLQSESILLLITSGADVGAQNRAGETPLHLLCRHVSPSAAAVVSCMRSIIELPRTVLPNLDLTVKAGSPSTGFSLMHEAVQADNWPLVQLLCQYCSSLVNSRSDTHGTPLHLAARDGLLSIAETLLRDFNAFVNARDDDGMTALLFACRHGHLRLAQLLVKHGANVHVEEDGSEGTALHLACRAGDFAMVKWLVKKCGLRPEQGEGEDGESPEEMVRSLLTREGGDEDEDDEEEGDRLDAYRRIADWLAAWSLADKMGLPVEEVLAEMNGNSGSGGEKKVAGTAASSKPSRMSKR